MFNLTSDWRGVMASSLSFWMQIFGLLVLIVPEILYVRTGQDYDPVLAWWLGMLLLMAGVIGRIWRQGLPWWREWMRLLGVLVLVVLLALLATRVAVAASWIGVDVDPQRVELASDVVREAETLKVAVPFIAREEGKRNRAYQDIVGVWTICYGSTRGVSAGMVKTDAECLDLLGNEVAEYREGLHRYFSVDTISHRLTPHRDAAYTSLAFNAGIRAIGRSTATRRLNAGDIAGGCDALTWWNKAGRRVIRGLVARRTRERDLCLKGFK